ncbi:hypothetical protein [Patulibacter sp.]|uniref:hypothetical protein n=1 Tax=Patulibacter sp. TaxID=1912859 RepID=UPI002718FB71|nr:hypothetical protein [Patulibacter sp.]MDO9409923.1 hypothetical protein [Patulibacter sp.]
MVSVLERLPALATTGVGSLPFDDPAVAVRHATRAYGVPFCPQLPRSDGDMVREWLGPQWTQTPCGWTTERDRERPAAWDAFVEALQARPPEHRVVKLQATGPVTLAVAMERAAGRSGVGRDVATLARELAGWLASSVAGQTARLRELDLDVLLVVDEPGLAHASGDPRPTRPGAASAVDARVWDPLRGAASAWGLHVCSAVPWALVRAAEPDVLSFDATRYAVGGAGAVVLHELVARGGRIAWGALDPVRPDAEFDAAARIGAAVGAVTAAGGDLETLIARSLVTPSCGTGRLAPARERLVASVLDAAAAAVGATWRSWPRSGVRATG